MDKLHNKAIGFLSMCEGYHSRLKTIHWSTTNKSEHLLTDDIDESVLDYEDKLAEVIMGYLGTRFTIGELTTMLPSAKTVEALLKELKGDVLDFKDAIGDNKEHNGIQNVLDDFLTDINKWEYLRTLK